MMALLLRRTGSMTSDTAHIIQQLDLVITVDTAVAHLSGALNKPTWLYFPIMRFSLAERYQ